MAEVSFDVPSGLPDAMVLLTSAQMLMAMQEAADRDEAVQTIFKLMHGVLASPEDPKKRKVRKSNETFNRKVGRHTAALDFLRAAGFLVCDDPDAPEGEGVGGLLHMRVAYLARLTDAHHTLAQASQQAGLTVPPLPGGGFNPYQSNVQLADTTRATKVPEGWKTEAERVRDEVKKRQREMVEKVREAPPVDLQPTTFWLSAGRRLEDVIRAAAEEPLDEAKAADNVLLQEQVALAKAAIAGPSKFESADKRRLAELSRKSVHQSCILRVICPDKSVLQAHFRAADRGEHVYAQLAPLMAPGIIESGWYLYQSPPMKRLSPKDTLAAAGLTPGANMYLGFEGQKPSPPFFIPSLADQLGPVPESQGGVTEPASFNGEAMGWGQGRKLGAGGGPGKATEAPTS